VSFNITLYVILNLVFSCVPYKSASPSVWYPDMKTEIAVYIANRTGVLSFANIALAVLFAGRVNPLIYVTGLSQTTWLIFHRWAARVATVQAIVHSIIYTFKYFWVGGAEAFYTEAAMAYYWWGIIATIAFSLALVFAILPIRLRMYEVFLFAHIVIVILALVGCWYHIQLRFAQDWGYEIWLYITFAFWGFDRLCRVAIGAYRNMGGITTQAIAELMPGGTFIKITVFPSAPWTAKAGQHAFLSFQSTGRFWETHPFSVAGWNNGSNTPSLSSASITEAGDKGPEKEMSITTAPVDTKSTTTTLHQFRGLPERSITFLIRPFQGITKSLHEELLHSPAKPIPISLTLEGPYGHSVNIQNADSILCIGGGIGITALLAYVQAYIEGRRAGTMKASRLLLAWSHRERELAEIVRKMLPADAEAWGLECVWTFTGGENPRMAVGGVLKAEMEGVKRLAVLVCAPGEMADDVRREVVANFGIGGTKIDYHEESFAW
jgi:predicted ferric reductase